MAQEVLIGYDGSGTSDDALALGLRLARDLGAKPVVLAAFRFPQYLAVPEEIEEALHVLSGPVLEEARRAAGDAEMEALALADGSPAHALTEMAGTRRPLAIAIGSAHRGTLGRLLLGSAGRSLLSGAPCPVAVAPRGYAAEDPGPWSRIGVGLDGSAESWSALAAAASLASRLGAELHTISVVPPPPPDIPGAVLGLLSAADVGEREAAEREKLLDDARSRAPAGVEVRSHLIQGEAAKGLCQASGDLDLLVLGSRGYGPLRSALLGSTSAVVAETATVPIIVLPRGAGDDPLQLDSEPASSQTGAG